jgi:hypothetical protein
MPRTCLACSSSSRTEIDKALVAGEALRNIAERVSISPPSLLRHKSHVATSIGKAQAKREEAFGASLLADMRRLKERLWAQVDAAELDGDRAAFTGLAREVRQTIGGLFELAERAALGNNAVSLAGAPDDVILAEAERRGLKVPMTFKVVYTEAPTRFDKVLDVEPQS